MAYQTFFDRLSAQVRSFRTAERGHVVMTFALATVPIMGFVGSAVDYSRANSAKAAMQGAIDSTALMLSKSVTGLTQEQINQKASDYFKALFNRTDVTNIVITPVYTTTDGAQIVLTGKGSVSTTLMNVVGLSKIDIDASSTVKWGTSRLRVALVLDTTGSMSDAGKMPALKNATNNLLTQLKTAASQNGDVYVSIIPFSKNVNVGGTNHSASWIDWTDWEAEPVIINTAAKKPSNWEQVGPGSSCPFTSSNHGFVCTTGPANGASNASNIPSSGTYSGYICPGKDGGNKDSTKIGIYYNGCYNSVQSTRQISSGSGASCGTAVNCSCSGNGSNKVCTQTYYAHTWRPEGTPAAPARSTWNGCVTDRGTTSAPSGDYDRKVTAPSTSIPATLFPAEQNFYCSPEIMGLSYDWATMTTLVNNLYPLGATNQPIGLVWGWQSLVGGGPLTAPAKDSNYTYNEAIVLMSDGLNTLDRWYGNGSSTNTSVDQRMYESAIVGTCANVKAAGITIYAVHVNTDNSAMSTLLKNCASSPDKFWMVTSGSELGSVFNTIGTNLSKLRVAK